MNDVNLTCFFCQENIPAEVNSWAETRTYKDTNRDFVDATHTYAITKIVPKDFGGTVSLKFKPAYTKRLEQEIEKAEVNLQQILTRMSEELGLSGKVKVYLNEDTYKYRVRKIFELEFLNEGYATDSATGQYKSHNTCAKKSLTLEQIANNPLVAAKFHSDLASLPIPMRGIYDALKHGRVMIIAKPLNIKDYSQGR